MTTLSHSESRRKYSWWWDSHNAPKNSKWLQENITDMDGKVKTMIKLIEEDADSFARRAEMYYKKRPELMKLVEEFYRAYRALAERYNHATGELRYAHRTIAAAFPDQVPFELIEDSPTEKDGEPDAVLDLIGSAHALSESDLHAINRNSPRAEDSEGGMRKRGLKQLQEMFGGPKNEKDREGGELLQLSNENQNLKEKCRNETERAGKAAREVEGLKKALSDMEAEKEKVVMKYKQCLAKLSEIEGELSNAQMDSMRLDEKASRAEIEVHTLKEALVQFEVEKIAGMIKHEECLGKISHLEARASQFQKDKNALDGRAAEAENQAQALKVEMTRLELEKETVVCQYKHCLDRISELEKIVSISEDEARMAKNRAERAETEVSELKKAVANLNKEKEASALQYKYCLETISELEKDLASARDDVKRLKNEVLVGSSKLKDVKEKSSLLEMSNQALRVEADDLSKEIEIKDLELSDKQEELEKLQSCLQDENSRRAQVEGALWALQNLHTQSEDDHRALAEELKNTFQMLKEMEVSKNGLEEEIRQVRDENLSLSESTSCSAASVENMQNEIFSLREIRERLEKEVSYHNGVSVSLEQEISCLKKEIEGLNRSYKALVEQVEAAGLDPKCVRTSIKSLQDEKLRLEELCGEGKNEKAILSKKLASIEGVLKKKAEVEGSLSDLNDELAMSREKVNALQESCQYLSGEKATLVAEKASLLSQLQAMTENMNSLVRQNAVIENSLSMAKVELEGLREKSKGLEEICDLLKNERSYLLAERDTLVRKLENVERRLENLEKKFTGLEEKYGDLEKENEAMQCQVKKLTVLLGDEKQERIGFQLVSETRMVGLENEIHILQEENRWKKKESEEEHDKAVKAQFEISILQKFMKEMEEKNCSLIIECQKHVDASKMAEKVISELESESLEQQVEAELLLDEIERLRLGIYQIFRALDTGLSLPEEKLEDERALVDLVMESVESMKSSMSRNEDEKQKLVFENSVILALLEQLETKGVDIELQKIQLEKEARIMAKKNAMVKNEKDKLVEINEQLKLDVDEGRQAAAVLQAELGTLCVKQDDLQEAYNVLQKAFSRVNQENSCLLKKCSDVIKEKRQVDQFNDAVVMELLATTNQSAVLESFATEKIVELKSLLEDLNRQYQINSSLDKEMSELGRKLDLHEAENLVLKDTVCRLEREMQEIKERNVQIKQDIVNGKESLIRTEAKLFETETKLETAENLNSTLCQTVEELKIDMDRSMEIREDLEKNVAHLSETNSEQQNEIKSLHRVNKDLESELGFLRQEIEENMVREQTLSTELQGMTDEFELWENEASTFCFDLQVSSINEVLLKNKVQELTGVCRNLKDEHAGKMLEIDQMKEQIRSMENEISGLKSQLSAYGPLVASLRDDITLIERNALLRMKLKAADDQDTEFFEIDSHSIRDTSLIPQEDESFVSLQNLQMRVKAVGKLMEETNKPVSQRRSVSNTKQESTIGENDQMKESCILRRQRSKKKGRVDELNDSPKLQKIKNKASEARNGMLMKDIPLDQVSNSSMRKKKGNGGSDDLMLELWEAADDDKGGRAIAESLKISYRLKQKSELPLTDSDIEREFGVDKLELSTRTIADPSQEANDEKILERLAFDADKLVCLQTTVANLRWILETDKKGRKGKNVDFDTVEEQLQEADDTIVHLFDLNGQLVKNIEDCPHDETLSPRMKETVKTWRTKVMEQAEKGSERIESLQLSVQKILFVLSKMEDECKNKGRNKFMRNRTVILRDFIQYGKKNSGRRKKGPRCGCFRQATASGNGK